MPYLCLIYYMRFRVISLWDFELRLCVCHPSYRVGLRASFDGLEAGFDLKWIFARRISVHCKDVFQNPGRYIRILSILSSVFFMYCNRFVFVTLGSSGVKICRPEDQGLWRLGSFNMEL